jgi:NADH dehydrogenase (ubiquinone) 1 beta subcomplex subunit 10
MGMVVLLEFEKHPLYKKKIPYYHRRFKRVPTIDECVLRDMPCVFEANEQYKRDKYVKPLVHVTDFPHRKC